MFAVNSLGFVLFAALFLAAWFACRPATRWMVLLGASVVFYLSLDIPGFVVLAACAAVVWQCARRVAKNGWFTVGLAAGLGPLLLLKYYAFAAGGVGALLRVQVGQVNLLQPLGLAYFSLMLTGYLLDVRRGACAAEPSFWRVLCFAGNFFSITQGPFLRYGDFMPQLAADTCWDGARAMRGVQRCAWGFFKKWAIAERCAVVVNATFANPAAYDRTELLIGTVLFSLQLYADFSGYTDIVLGVGEAAGLHLPENFRQPFLAATVHELWARWHISLSQWFRDYVYIPLGGNRKGAARRDANLILTFLASGLWHGANMTFVVWGGLHGLCQAVENHLPWRRAITKGWARLVGIVGTFGVFVLTFTIFNAQSLSAAAVYFSGLLHNGGHAFFGRYWALGLTSQLELVLLLLGVAVLVAVDVAHECGARLRDTVNAAPRAVRWGVYLLAVFAFLFMGRFLGGGGFLYARF